MLKKLLKWLVVIIVLLAAFYVLGPKPDDPVYTSSLPVLPSSSAELETFVRYNEAQHKIKPGNEAKIIWANDSLKQKTEYAFVYLHGFSASPEEGAPVHTNIAKKFGCNLYLARLAEHGIDTTEQMVNLTAGKYWESVKEAYAIGKKLGNKVIIIGTSTGGSNALQLAATYPEIAGIVLLSPNIEINDPNAWLANNAWGLQIARLVKHSNYITTKDQRDIFKKFWYSHYRLEAVVNLQEYLETTMTAETFRKIKQPALLLYYYRDTIHQDSVVKVSAMLRMFDELATTPEQKRKLAMPNTGDHVIAGYIKSNDYQGVEAEITKFMIDILHMKLVQ